MSSPMDWNYDTPPSQKRPFEAYSVGQHVETRAGQEYSNFGSHPPGQVYVGSASLPAGQVYVGSASLPQGQVYAGSASLPQGQAYAGSASLPQGQVYAGSAYHPSGQVYAGSASLPQGQAYREFGSSPPVQEYSNSGSPLPIPKYRAWGDHSPDQVYENFGMRKKSSYFRDMLAACTPAPAQDHYMSGALPAPTPTPAPRQDHYMAGALAAPPRTPAPRQDHYMAGALAAPPRTPSPSQQYYYMSGPLPAPPQNPVSVQNHYMSGALPVPPQNPAPVRDYYVSGAFPNPDNDPVSAPDYHISGELPASVQEPELVHTEQGLTILEQVHLLEDPAQPTVMNRIAGIVYNVTLWTGICLLNGLLYPPRLVYSNRGSVKQAASDTYRVAIQAVDGIKRRAVELRRPRPAPTPQEERREILRASHRPLRSSTSRPSRASPPKMTTHTTEQICDPLDYLRPPPTWQDECIQREFKLARVQDKFIDMLIQECKVADAREAFLATGANLVACPALAASNTDNQSGADNEHQDESVEAVSETAIKTDNVGTTEERTSEFFPGLRELVADYVMTTLVASNTDNRSSTTNKHQNKSVKAIPRTAINTDIIRTTEERTSEIFQGVSELVSDYTMPCLDATNTDKQSDPTTVHQDESFEAVSKTAVNTDIAGPAEERTLESFGGVSESVSDHDMDGVDNNQGDLERIIDVLTETASSPLSEAPEDLEDIPLPPKSAKSVAFLVSPRTGRPVTRVKRFVVGEAMDHYLSSSPSVSSTCPEGSVERMEAEASESPLEYHLAKMEGCSHEDALKQIPNGAVPDRRTNYIKIASGTPAEIQAWNNKDKHNTASPSNGSFQASSTSTNAKTQNGQSTEKAASLMVEPSEALRTPDSAAATVDESQKERKAPSPTAEATMATMMTATPTVPTTPMTRSVFAKDAMDSMQEGMGVFSISSRTRKVRDTVRKQKAEEARLAKARREAEGEAKKKAEAEEERKKTGVRRMPTEKVIKPLSAEWERKVDAALAAGDGAQLATTSTGNRLKRKDFGTVLPVAGRDRAGGWLNDEIITGYLQAVVDHGQAMTNSTGRGKTPKYYAFNTFFYSNIRDKGVESVRRWAARGKVGGKALLDVERVFIPVHEHSHWTNIVVGPMARTIEYFDSMGGSPRRYIANVKAWLRQELGPAYVEEEWAVVNSSSPQQQNGLDCGVFAATTAKMIMLGIDPMAYGHEDIPTQRRRMVAELLNGGFHVAFEP